MTIVCDASVVIAHLKQEPTRIRLEALLVRATIGAINLSEVAAFMARKGLGAEQVHEMIRELQLRAVPLDVALGIDAGLMRPITDKAGLSLADRCCLALAKRLGVPAATADRDWARIADAVGVEVQLIR